MKFLIVICIVLAVLWFARSNRRAGDRDADSAARRPGPAPKAQEMVRCASCGVHLPLSDALPGPDGHLYCCAEHRLRGGA